MPIYDNDGTANREIGTLYDYNGSVNTQIGKVYDNNGTTNSLIYDLNPGLLVGSGASASYVNQSSSWQWWNGTGSASISPTNIVNTSTSSADTWLYCTQPLPKGYTKLQYNFVKTGIADCRFVIGTSVRGYNVLNVNVTTNSAISINSSTNYYISLAVYGNGGKASLTYLKLS